MNISTLATVALGQMPCKRLDERVSPPKRICVHFTLGIRENTRMTVTVVKSYLLSIPFQGF